MLIWSFSCYTLASPSGEDSKHVSVISERGSQLAIFTVRSLADAYREQASDDRIEVIEFASQKDFLAVLRKSLAGYVIINPDPHTKTGQCEPAAAIMAAVRRLQ